MTGNVVSRATALKNASIIIRPARQGSFIFDLVVLIEAHPATAAVIVAPPFYDFIKVVLKRATGLINAVPETPILKKLYKNNKPLPVKKPLPDLDDLAIKLEGSLQAAHKPIGQNGTINRMDTGQPRKNLVSFDIHTGDRVNTRNESCETAIYQGNMTRYNTLSRNGRAFIDQPGRVVPVIPDGDFPAGDLENLSWSLHGSNTGDRNKLVIQARTVTSSGGHVKRLLLSGCQKAPDQ